MFYLEKIRKTLGVQKEKIDMYISTTVLTSTVLLQEQGVLTWERFFTVVQHHVLTISKWNRNCNDAFSESLRIRWLCKFPYLSP
jgi:hypothetical protein